MEYPCVFCGTKLPTRSSRKTHNKTCIENKNRARNQEIGKRASVLRFNEYGSREGAIAAFECMAEDLPDGAYFAMMEELGLDVDDLVP